MLGLLVIIDIFNLNVELILEKELLIIYNRMGSYVLLKGGMVLEGD